jgi:hypothetical protein
MAVASWRANCKRKGMSNTREQIILEELEEIKALESRLQRSWTRLGRAGEKVQRSFISSLDELKIRTRRLESLLDPIA